MAVAFADRVAVQALTIRPVAILLWVVAAPFWLIGFMVGVLWWLVRWVLAAVLVGWADAAARRERRVNDGTG